jgi:hypothetical protein
MVVPVFAATTQVRLTSDLMQQGSDIPRLLAMSPAGWGTGCPLISHGIKKKSEEIRRCHYALPVAVIWSGTDFVCRSI